MKRLFSISHSIWFIQAIFLKPAYILCFDVMVNRTNTGYQSKNVNILCTKCVFQVFLQGQSLIDPTIQNVNGKQFFNFRNQILFQLERMRGSSHRIG